MCGKPAMMACPLCGQVTCKTCFNPDARVCRVCARKMAESQSDEEE
jgi:hypothetical protein